MILFIILYVICAVMTIAVMAHIFLRMNNRTLLFFGAIWPGVWVAAIIGAVVLSMESFDRY